MNLHEKRDSYTKTPFLLELHFRVNVDARIVKNQDIESFFKTKYRLMHNTYGACMLVDVPYS